MEKLTIWLDLIASLLALVVWSANEVRERLNIIHKNASNWAKKYKYAFFGILAVLVFIDVLSAIFPPISLVVSVFLVVKRRHLYQLNGFRLCIFLDRL